MSSRRPSHNASKSSSLQGWSKWEWNETFNCESRTRLKKGRNEYEYEYRNFKERETPQLSEHDDLNPPPGTSAQGASSHSRGSFSSRRDTNHIHGQAQTLDYTANTVSSMQYTSSYSSNQVMSNITSGMAQMDLNHISGTPDSGRYEPFDKRYKIHRGSEFEQFRVFKVLWSEPQGGNTNSVGSHDTRSIRETKNGTQFAKVRRFVIISPMSGHCLCLPINTYLRQGTTKKGVHAEDHTIVYTDNPVYLEGEWEKGMTREPIQVECVSPRDKLEPESRLNYTKVYTVECNVKVWFIGKVQRPSTPFDEYTFFFCRRLPNI